MAEIFLEGFKRFVIAFYECLAVAVAGDGNDFARVFAIWSVKLITVFRALMMTIYDIAQMQEESWSAVAFPAVIFCHSLSDLFRHTVMIQPARVANCMKAD